jgi:hypothetical protein
MPYKSDAQRKWAHTAAGTKGRKLPARRTPPKARKGRR